jgi:type IV fimbrial biogenesis protein FimT
MPMAGSEPARSKTNTDRILRQAGRTSGFSLLEVLVVIGILSLAAAIVLPAMFGWRGNMQLRASARELRGDLAMAKAFAAKENATVRVAFDAAANSYRLEYTGLDGNPRLIKSITLPAGVRIDKEHPDYSMTGDRTSFTSRGGADNGTMVLTSDRGESKKITVSILGKITLED